jgi:uncharacterized protein (TIGR00251 family)
VERCITLRVKVKPNARESSLVQESDGTWLARLKSPPVDGKANQELIELVAERFQCRKSEVLIKSGASSRMKVLTVQGT